MKIKNEVFKFKNLGFLKIKIIIGLLLLAFLVSAANEITQSTPNSVAYYGYLNINGTQVSVGSFVSAYDMNGVLCGKYTIDTTGQYGFMHVYGDDPNSPEDEGPLPGQLVSFYLNDTMLLKKVLWPGGPNVPIELNFSVNYAGLPSEPAKEYLDKRILFLKRITILDSDYLTRADDLVVSVNMVNMIGYDLENLRMTVDVFDLGEWVGTSRFDLNEDDQTTKTVALPLEYSTPGLYTARITVSNDRVKRIRHRDFYVIK